MTNGRERVDWAKVGDVIRQPCCLSPSRRARPARGTKPINARRALGSLILAFAVLIAHADAVAADDRQAADASYRSVIIAVRPLSQLSEPAPPWWTLAGTPYCVAATTAMALEALGEELPTRPLATLFDIGHGANVTGDLGIDPVGAVGLFARFGYAADIELPSTQRAAMAAIVERLDAGYPVIALTKGGDHAVLVYGYAGDAAGGVREVYVVDPLRPVGVTVPLVEWLSAPGWMRDRFAAPGVQWQGAYVLVTLRSDARTSEDELRPTP